MDVAILGYRWSDLISDIGRGPRVGELVTGGVVSTWTIDLVVLGGRSRGERAKTSL